ncbi:hypothetical protein DFP73DRAFT_523584 [Morchella snyderi]|nr:hypothetical protein DFP73DRAFT_523584 [Morchella snyderi]
MTPSAISSLPQCCTNKSHSGHEYAKSSLYHQSAYMPRLPRCLDSSTLNLRVLNDAFDVENPLEPSFDTDALTAYCFDKACGFDYRTYFDHEEEYTRSLEEQDVWNVSDKRNKEKQRIWMESYPQLDQYGSCSSNECRCDMVQCFVRHDNPCCSSQIEYSDEKEIYVFSHESDYCMDISGLAITTEYGPEPTSGIAQSREKSPGLNYYDFVNEEGERTLWFEAYDRINNNYMRCGIAECCGGHDNSLCDSVEEDSHAPKPENTTYLSGRMSETDIKQCIDSSSSQYGGDDYYGYFDDEWARIYWPEAEECICDVLGCCGEQP